MTLHAIREMPRPNRRLDSWKEIAAFFGRDERTVKRWEKERSLPVHRLPGSPRARVFAFTDEMTQWMNAADSAGVEGITQEKPPSAMRTESSGGSARLSRAHSPRRWITIAAIAAILALAALGLTLIFRRKNSIAMIRAGETASSTSAATVGSAKSSGTVSVDSEAQDLYLKGRYYWDKRTPDDLNQAVDFFDQAIVKDPNYAQAYVGLADCYNLLREYAAMPSEEAYPRALAAARKAVELDDSSAEAHNSLAFVTFYWNWDVDGAEREFRRALELNPKYVVAHHWYATFLMTIGRLPEALKQIEEAQRLDPASTPILADKALILFHQGHTDQAIGLLKQLEVAQPAFFSTHQYLSDIYLASRDYANWLEEARQSAELSHDESQLAILHAAEQGFKSRGAKGMLESILGVQKKLYSDGRMPAFFVATTCAYLGNKAEALRYLQTSDRRHESSFTSIRVHQAFRSLHDDPSFRNLVMQAGLPPLA